MYLCYIDESGGFEAPGRGPGATPLMLFAGLIISADAVSPLTADLLALKRKFYPGKAAKHLDYLRAEIKGADLRSAIRSTSRRKQRHAFGVLDGVVTLLERHDVRLVGRVWIKEATTALDPGASYAFAIQDIARHFNSFLVANDSQGMLLCDSRLHRQDAQVAHSLFTQKYKRSGDELPRLVEPQAAPRRSPHALRDKAQAASVPLPGHGGEDAGRHRRERQARTEAVAGAVRAAPQVGGGLPVTAPSPD